jgi:hypothetical protein
MRRTAPLRLRAATPPCDDTALQIGATSGPILTGVPMPLNLIWSRLAVAAHQQGCAAIRERALGVLVDHYIEVTPSKELWQVTDR